MVQFLAIQVRLGNVDIEDVPTKYIEEVREVLKS